MARPKADRFALVNGSLVRTQADSVEFCKICHSPVSRCFGAACPALPPEAQTCTAYQRGKTLGIGLE